MAKVTITWHAIEDERTCKICKALDGYTWVFEMGKNQFAPYFVHPVYGLVWTLELGSNAHGHHGTDRYNCRCWIEPHIYAEDILAKCVYIEEMAHEKAAELGIEQEAE
jgi:hypothetical protein